MAKSKIGINLQLPADVYNDFKAICNFNETSMTQAATDLIRGYLDDNKKLVDALNVQQKLFDDAMKKVIGGDSPAVKENLPIDGTIKGSAGK